MTVLRSGKASNLHRRTFLKDTAAAAIASAYPWRTVYAQNKNASARGKKVVLLACDGMDPVLVNRMIDAGELPNLATLRANGGAGLMQTTNPPQTPVCFASFITGADPGVHGIFDFIHRDPALQCLPASSFTDELPGKNLLVGKYRIPIKAPKIKPLRQGVPFWEYLEEIGVSSLIFDIPSNYPPTPSRHGLHRCIAGMGTPDMIGSYGTYQHFAQNGPIPPDDSDGGGVRYRIAFRNEIARSKLFGPPQAFLQSSVPVEIPFTVYRDTPRKTAAIEIQGHTVLLREGDWSEWVQLQIKMDRPLADLIISGICRFYLQEVAPNFRLYVSPINIDPTAPADKISEPTEFVSEIARDLGLFYTTGFQEDHKALFNGIFTDQEYAKQAGIVLEERLKLLHYGLDRYDSGVFFFYFSNTDLESHMFWWDRNSRHPTRSAEATRYYFEHLKDLYRRMDNVLGDILQRYGKEATVLFFSDHGFSEFARQFNLNTWLRDNGYLGPPDVENLLGGGRSAPRVDWSVSRAYGIGLNGLYLNLKGREREGIVKPGPEAGQLLDELTQKLLAVRDDNGQPVITSVARADRIYSNTTARAMAPDLLIGYARGYRSSWGTATGDMTEPVLSDNLKPWAATHCGDPRLMPGVLFANRPLPNQEIGLWDLAPTILKEYGIKTPPTMTGKPIV